MTIKYNTKAVVTIPGWAEAMHNASMGAQKDSITSAALAYAYVPLVARAVQLRASSLANCPIYFYKENDDLADWPFPEVDLRDLVWKSEAALLLDGANFIEKIKRIRSQKVAGLRWVNPTTMDNPKAVKGIDGLDTIVFTQKGNVNGKWTLDDMIYMREFSLRDDVGKGEAAAKTSLNDAALIRYMGRFAARFFETGAMPVTVLQIDGIVDRDEAQRIEGFFKRQATRIRNAWNVLALGRAIEPKVISQPLKDLVMPDLNNQARHAVSLAFGIPQTMLAPPPTEAVYGLSPLPRWLGQIHLAAALRKR